MLISRFFQVTFQSIVFVGLFSVLESSWAIETALASNYVQASTKIKKKPEPQKKFDLDLANESDPKILELISNGASMEDIALIRGPAIQNAEQAIRELKMGNLRFFNGQTIRPDVPANLRRIQILSQTPYAVILGCSDSRVPPEIVYDQGIGSIFSTRNAGNIADTGTLGSIEYAVKHLKPHLIVVMGHEGCGAVQAAMTTESEKNSEPLELQTLIKQILPAVDKLPIIRDRKARMREAEMSNIRYQVSRLNENPTIKAAITKKKIQIIGAFYEISSGLVEFLDTPEELKIK